MLGTMISERARCRAASRAIPFFAARVFSSARLNPPSGAGVFRILWLASGASFSASARRAKAKTPQLLAPVDGAVLVGADAAQLERPTNTRALKQSSAATLLGLVPSACGLLSAGLIADKNVGVTERLTGTTKGRFFIGVVFEGSRRCRAA